jgi:PAS domain S-box-containing protein
MSPDPLRVLIIEDVPMDAELVEYELGRARIPFQARRVDTRELFLAELRAFEPDVILSDYTLPRFDGMAALELARSHAPATPFLIVTGSINEETAVGAMKAGRGGLPPQEQPGADRTRHRGRPGPGSSPERKDAGRRCPPGERGPANRDLFDNASDLVCATDREGRFLYVNRAWHEGTGYSDTELAALRFGDLVHPESKARYTEVIARALAGETLTHVELTLMPRSDVPIVVEGNLSGARQADGSVTLRGIYRDVTERKRVDEQLRRAERMQAAGRLAGGMAHEVNNMMTGVIGFAEFLLRGLAPEDPRRSEVQEIIRAGSRAADVTRQLLAFTRQQLMHPEVLAINDVVLGLERMLRHSLGENHELELRLGTSLREVRADRGQLEQVLINLILNARDALPARGRVTIATSAAELDEAYAEGHGDVGIPAGAYVLLSVSDTGCGMDPEVQAKIFEPFFTTKPVGQGTGLGLSTVYGIVKQSGGFIWCYSEPRLGSTFKVYLPVLRAASPPAPPAARPAAPRGRVGNAAGGGGRGRGPRHGLPRTSGAWVHRARGAKRRRGHGHDRGQPGGHRSGGIRRGDARGGGP